MFNLKGLVAAALIAATPAQAQQAGPDLLAYQQALTALGDPIELICAPGLRAVLDERARDPVARLAAEFLADDQMMQQFYQVAFDKAAAADLLAQLQKSVNITSGAVFGQLAMGMTPAQIETGIRELFAEFGLSPDNIIDVTVLYLAVLWAAQGADAAAIQDVGIYVGLREQVALAEGSCFILGSTDDLPALRNTLIARIMVLADGIEMAGMSGEAEAFGSFVRDRFGLELQGMRLVGGEFQ